MSLSFKPGSTLVPRRRRTAPTPAASLPTLAASDARTLPLGELSVETVPSLVSDISSHPSQESVLATPPLSSRTSSADLPSPTVETRPELDLSGGLPEHVRSIPAGAVRRSGDGRPWERGTYAKEHFQIPLPPKSFGYEQRSLSGGRVYVAEEEDIFFADVEARHAPNPFPRSTPFSWLYEEEGEKLPAVPEDPRPKPWRAPQLKKSDSWKVNWAVKEPLQFKIDAGVARAEAVLRNRPKRVMKDAKAAPGKAWREIRSLGKKGGQEDAAEVVEEPEEYEQDLAPVEEEEEVDEEAIARENAGIRALAEWRAERVWM